MKKIMFNDKYKLTEAVLSGRKTQTRRIITCPRRYHGIEVRGFYVSRNIAGDVVEVCMYDEDERLIDDGHILPKYKVGEEVAVAQSYKDAGFRRGYYRDEDTLIPLFVGKDTKNDIPVATASWTNKMFVRADLMPHRLLITGVRVERLQDISDEDCIKEGVRRSNTDNRIGYPFGIPFNYFIGEDKKGCRYSTPREAYAALIDKVLGKGTWESNPYVFVYDFELIQ